MKLWHLANTNGSGQLPQWSSCSFGWVTSLVQARQMSTWSLGTQFYNQPSRSIPSQWLSFHWGWWWNVSLKFFGAVPVSEACLNLLSVSYMVSLDWLGKGLLKGIENRRWEQIASLSRKSPYFTNAPWLQRFPHIVFCAQWVTQITQGRFITQMCWTVSCAFLIT